MKWIGITGGIASGKSTALEIIKEAGYETFSCDETTKEIWDSGTVQKWWINYWLKRGGIRTVLFTPALFVQQYLDDQNLREAFDQWIHPQIRQKMLDSPALICEVPLLFEKNLEDLFQKTWCISCNEETQWKRIFERRKWSEDLAKEFMALHLSNEEKCKRASRIIPSGGDLYFFEETVRTALRVDIQRIENENNSNG